MMSTKQASMEAAAGHLVTCAINAGKAVERRDDPDRVRMYLRDVERWASALIAETDAEEHDAGVVDMAERFRPREGRT